MGVITQRRYRAMTDPKDDQGLVEDETENETPDIDTGADDDGPKNDPVPVDPDGGDEGDRKDED